MPSERVHKLISQYGTLSRRAAEKLIADGKVLVNGEVAVLGQSADIMEDEIIVDGTILVKSDELVYIMLNKPQGFLSTVRDDRNRPTVMELLKDVPVRVFPVGRLDLNTKGLLLFTNDGEFANHIMHPSFEIPKTYEIHMSGDITRAVKELRKPFEIDGHTVQAVYAGAISTSKHGGVISIVIKEGRNRQIRRMCARCDITIKLLRRVSVGSLSLDGLETGKWRYLAKSEILDFNIFDKK